MAQAVLLILAAMVAISSFAQGFVLPHFAQLMGADYEYAEETPATPTPTPNYIMRIAQPHELRAADVVDVTKFIDAAAIAAPNSNQESAEANEIGAAKLAHRSKATVAADEQRRRQGKTLTYTELDQLLANWQLDKERNTYEMQASNRHGINAHWN